LLLESQGAQQAQLSKQIADQEQITALQMKLAQFQIIFTGIIGITGIMGIMGNIRIMGIMGI